MKRKERRGIRPSARESPFVAKMKRKRKIGGVFGKGMSDKRVVPIAADSLDNHERSVFDTSVMFAFCVR